MVPVSLHSAIRDHVRISEPVSPPKQARGSQQSHSASDTHYLWQRLPYGDFENVCKDSLSPHGTPYDSSATFGPHLLTHPQACYDEAMPWNVSLTSLLAWKSSLSLGKRSAKPAHQSYLNVAGKSCPVPKHTEKQQIPRSHGFRDPEVVRVGRTHLPVAYPRSDLTSLRYPSPPRLRITGRLTPV